MPPRRQNHPTAAETEILQALWKLGEGTVRDVQGELKRLRPTGYTTVLKLLQTMKEKHLVDRTESERAHVYRALVSEAEVRSGVLRGVTDRVFGGSLSTLVLHAIQAGNVSARDLAEIQAMLRRKVKRGNPS